MRTEIKQLHQRLGATIVYVTHDQIEAMTLATRIAVMKEGVLQQFGTPARDLRATRPTSSSPASWARPSMNLIPARLEQADGGLGVRVARGEEGDIVLPLHNGAGDGIGREWLGRDVILGLRPEAIADPRDPRPTRRTTSRSRR